MAEQTAATDYRSWPRTDGWQEAQIAKHLAWVAEHGFTSVEAARYGDDVFVEYIVTDGTHIRHNYFAMNMINARTFAYRTKRQRIWREPIWPEDPRYDHALAERTRRERQGDGATEGVQ